MKPRFVVAVLLMILFAAVQAPTQAGASRPDRYTFEFEYSFVDSDVCEFPIVLSTVATATVWDFLDQEGNFTRSTVKVTDVTAATNPANQESVSGKNNWVNTIDWATLEQTVVGLFTHLNVPGAGIVVHNAGAIRLGPPPGYEVTFEAGKHEGYMEGDTAALCSALA